MSDVSVKNNAKEFLEALDEAKEKIFEEWGQVAEGYAKRLCPVRTGRLRNSISHDSDNDSAYIGTNVEYAPFVETGARGRKAQPYLKPAVADHANEYRTIAQNILRT